jgi:mono/diheme cytochrome c family protein
MRTFLLFACISLTVSAQTKAPKIWDDKALEDWATPIAALGVRPGHYTAAEYYRVPAENLKSYPVYRPDREPSGYWEWLRQQKPQPLVDAAKLRTPVDWIKAGEIAFRFMDEPTIRTSDRELIQAMRDPKKYEGVWTQADGSLQIARWVVTDTGVQLSIAVCAGCHGRALADGTIQWGAPSGVYPGNMRVSPIQVRKVPGDFKLPGDSDEVSFWRQFTVPWAPDDRIEKIRYDPEALKLIQGSSGPHTAARNHGSPFYATKVPDLHVLHYGRYIDATATHRVRGPEDVARYAAFVTGVDPMQFGSYKILPPEQRRFRFRYADEVLYAIGVYIMSLEPPKNPAPAPADLIARGQKTFERESCVNCHVPPNYTSGKLTLAEGFTPRAEHPNRGDIFDVCVGTDPGLAMKTRKGTGFYKIPSLRGVWYRPVLLHDGSVASLEEMFDPDRLKPDHVLGGWKGPGVTKRAIPGHLFGLELNDEDKQALLAFLRSL